MALFAVSMSIANTSSLAAEPPDADESQSVELLNDFDGASRGIGFDQAGPDHVVLTLRNHRYSFDGDDFERRTRTPVEGRLQQRAGDLMFGLKGIAGREMVIELRNVPWSDLAKRNPLYCLTERIESPANFEFRSVPRPAQPVAAANGPLIPDTSGQKWHFFTQVESPRPKTLVVRHRFPAGTDTVFIAMRPPYTPVYHRHLMKQLREDPRHEKQFIVHEVGRSWQNRPLHVVQIGGIEAAQARRFPCIVLYAREHGSEDDASWPLIGAIDYLLGSSREAVALRRRATFLIIPLLDPDAAAHNIYAGNVIYSFRINTSSKESRAFFHPTLQQLNFELVARRRAISMNASNAKH